MAVNPSVRVPETTAVICPPSMTCFSADRAAKNLFSGVKDQVDSYINNLQKLRGILRDLSNISCSVTVYRVLDDIGAIKEGLDSLRELMFDPTTLFQSLLR